MDIGVWLRSLSLEQYEAAFRENAIDADVLHDLTEQDLEKLGVLLGHRRKLLRAITALDRTVAASSALAPLQVNPPHAGVFPLPKPPATPAPETAGDRRHVTVMFCDLVNSTGIAAKLDAEEWRDLLGTYVDGASAAVLEMGGKIVRKQGDGLMVLFGYPVALENDAERAARAALAIQRSLAELNRKNAGSGKPALAASGGRYWSRETSFSATCPTSRPARRRWPSRVRSWSRRACRGRSPVCLLSRSAAVTNSEAYRSR